MSPVPGAPNCPPAENQIMTEAMIERKPRAKHKLLKNSICCLFIVRVWTKPYFLQANSLQQKEDGPSRMPVPYWHASHSPPLRIASIEQAVFSSSVKVFPVPSTATAESCIPALSSFLCFTVAFSMLEAPKVLK